MSTYYRGPVSDHFDGKRFFGPGRAGQKSLSELLRWRFGTKRALWPKHVDNPPPDPVLARAEPGTVRVTMIGHVTCLVQVEGANILVDPVWSNRASPSRFAGPRRVRKPGLAMDDLPQIDLVLVSHNHYDHLDLDTLNRLVGRHDPLIVTPLGNDAIIRAATPGARTIALDWDQRSDWQHLSITAVPVQHWSARGIRDRNAALWSGFVLNWKEHSIFIAGDTGFGAGWWARRARREDRPYDLAILPIAAYEPVWFMADAHMMPEEAVESFNLLNARHALGCHFGTFNLTDEPFEQPVQRLDQELRRRGIDHARFRTLLPGKAWTIPLQV